MDARRFTLVNFYMMRAGKGRTNGDSESEDVKQSTCRLLFPPFHHFVGAPSDPS